MEDVRLKSTFVSEIEYISVPVPTILLSSLCTIKQLYTGLYLKQKARDLSYNRDDQVSCQICQRQITKRKMIGRLYVLLTTRVVKLMKGGYRNTN